MKMLGWIFHAVCGRPRTVIAVALISAVLLGSQIPHLNIDLSLSQRFFGDDDALGAYDELRRDFGPEASLMAVVHVRNGTVWDPRVQHVMRACADEIAAIPGVAGVARVDALAAIGVSPERVRDLPIVRKLMVSRDDRSAAIFIEPSPEALTPSGGVLLVDAVRAVAERYSTDGISIGLAGPLVLQSAAIAYSRRDLKVITIVALIAILLILGLAFRSWWGVIAPLAVAAASTAIVLGVLALAGVSLSQFAFIALPVFVGLCVLDGVHIVYAYYEHRASIEDVLAKELNPCLWTSLTTLIGFVVLITSPIEQVRSIGLIIAIGVPVSFVLSFTLLPSLMSLAIGSGRAQVFDPFTGWAPRLARFVERRHLHIVIAAIVACVVAGVGIMRLHVAFDFPRIFRAGDPVQAYHDRVEKEFGGSTSLEVLLDARGNAHFADPEMIKRVAALSMALRLSANVATTVSYLDLGASYLMANRDGGEQPTFDEETVRRLATRIGEVSGGQELMRRWLTPDFKRARIHIKLRSARPDLHDKLEQSLESLKQSFAPWFDVRPTGFAYLYKSMERVLFESFLATFAYALIGVVAVLLLIARRARLGLAAMLANLMPIVMVLGIIGWFGQRISVGVVILPAVGLGLIADDTIHFLMAMKRGQGNLREAIEGAYRGTGWPIVLTQLVLLAAFGSLVASHFAANVTLGIFMSLLLILGLAFDLLFVPALVMRWGRSSKGKAAVDSNH